MINLVTGATGLVGMHIVLDLLSKNETVKATYTKNSSFETINSLFDFYNKKALLKKIQWLEMDIEDISQVYEQLKKVDHVYHCAAIVSFSKKERTKMHNINVKGTLNIVNACLENKIKKLGFVSSVAAIGRKRDGIYSENNSWIENGHNSFYAVSKYKAENEVWRGIQEGLNAVITNPGIIIGPSSWNRSSTSLFKKIYSGLSYYPSGTNGFVDVRDVASAHVLAMENKSSNGERFALAECDLWYKDIAKLLRENGFKKAPTFAVPVWLAKIMANFNQQLKVTAPYLGRVRSVAKTTKAKDILGWNPRPSEESILEIANQIKDMGLIK